MLLAPGGSEDGVSWTWQTCNEFGYFQTADLYYKMVGYDFGVLSDVNSCKYYFKDAG
jgi:hypothetical protein